jgi:hypothetical protein
MMRKLAGQRTRTSNSVAMDFGLLVRLTWHACGTNPSEAFVHLHRGLSSLPGEGCPVRKSERFNEEGLGSA